jgi:hypothetical protein
MSERRERLVSLDGRKVNVARGGQATARVAVMIATPPEADLVAVIESVDERLDELLSQVHPSLYY